MAPGAAPAAQLAFLALLWTLLPGESGFEGCRRVSFPDPRCALKAVGGPAPDRLGRRPFVLRSLFLGSCFWEEDRLKVNSRGFPSRPLMARLCALGPRIAPSEDLQVFRCKVETLTVASS